RPEGFLDVRALQPQFHELRRHEVAERSRRGARLAIELADRAPERSRHLSRAHVEQSRHRRLRQRGVVGLDQGMAGVEEDGLYGVACAPPWHFLYFFPLPQGQGSLRPTLGSSRRMVLTFSTGPCALAWAAFASAAVAPPPRACAVPPPTVGSGMSPPDSTVLRGRLCLTSGSASSVTICRRNSLPDTFWVMRSIIATNMSKPSFLYSCLGSFWPYPRRPLPSRTRSVAF